MKQQHHVVGVLCCRRDWCTSQNRCAGGTGAVHKIDGIMREDNYVDILKQHLKTLIRKLKQMGLPNGQLTPSILAKWLKDNKVKVLE